MMWQRKLQGLPTGFRLSWENGHFTEFKTLYTTYIYFKSDENETMLLG